MKGIIGVSEDLSPGVVIIAGDKQLVIVGSATEEEARAMAASLGDSPIEVVPGERFYRVDVTVLIPAAATN